MVAFNESLLFLVAPLPETATAYVLPHWVREGKGGGVFCLLLALIFGPFTTYPFRDRVPFLLLVDTPPTFGSSLRLF